MRRATRIVAALLGAFAGFGGPEHGYFEMMQGNVRPDGLFIASMGSPCEPDKIWNACEPAMTVIPSFFVTGILALIVGTITMIWAAALIQRKGGGVILILLSIALLLVGGGLFPPVIGIIAGIIGITINKPVTRQTTRLSIFFANLWPWPLATFFVWAFGQFVIGHFFNDWFRENALLVPLLIIGLIILSIVTGYAKDVQEQSTS